MPFDMELELAAGELGAVATGVGLSMVGPFVLTGFTGQFDLEIQSPPVRTVLIGVGPGTAVKTRTVPSNPALVGVQQFFQGVRLTSKSAGSFMRWGYYQVH